LGLALWRSPYGTGIIQVGAAPPCQPCFAISKRFIVCVLRNINDVSLDQ
jgi:hypothetical protein